MSFLTSLILKIAGILGLTFPRMKTVMTSTGACTSLDPFPSVAWTSSLSWWANKQPRNVVGFYAALNLIAWVMIFCFVRETKQLTLEEIDRMFILSCLFYFLERRRKDQLIY